ncbi:hypothetical protein [Frankia gtarii]|nr:hypothetical protein [Frankia gtarii]
MIPPRPHAGESRADAAEHAVDLLDRAGIVNPHRAAGSHLPAATT